MIFYPHPHYHHHHHPVPVAVAVIFDGNAAALLSSVWIRPYLYRHMPSLELPYRLLLCTIASSIDQYRDTSWEIYLEDPSNRRLQRWTWIFPSFASWCQPYDRHPLGNERSVEVIEVITQLSLSFHMFGDWGRKNNIGTIHIHNISYLLLVNHLPKLLITGMLIEPSSTAWQNIALSWLHYYFWAIDISLTLDPKKYREYAVSKKLSSRVEQSQRKLHYCRLASVWEREDVTLERSVILSIVLLRLTTTQALEKLKSVQRKATSPQLVESVLLAWSHLRLLSRFPALSWLIWYDACCRVSIRSYYSCPSLFTEPTNCCVMRRDAYCQVPRIPSVPSKQYNDTHLTKLKDVDDRWLQSLKVPYATTDRSDVTW